MPKRETPVITARHTLGRSGILVSPLCFGTLTLGPLQAGLPLKAGARLIRYALERGINFFDTADLYGTYPYLKEGLRGWGGETVIAGKSYDYTAEGMEKSLSRALRETGREHLDLFLLHEQESALTLKGHGEALEYLLRARERGLIRAVGISTHHVAAVRAACRLPELDVIHPLLNFQGIGIRDGSREDMVKALEEAAALGLGIYAMKPLGGGHLLSQAREAFRYILGLPFLASTAVGMQDEREIDVNCCYFSGGLPPRELTESLARRERRLIIHDWCQGCGQCLAACRRQALSLAGGKARVDGSACLLCGYCGGSCPQFCLKII
jgi:predicted aldo/keto reductase-like oxidoreductase